METCRVSIEELRHDEQTDWCGGDTDRDAFICECAAGIGPADVVISMLKARSDFDDLIAAQAMGLPGALESMLDAFDHESGALWDIENKTE